MASNEDGLRQIGNAAQSLRNYQGLAKLKGTTPAQERLEQKTELLHAIASAAFGEEALSRDEISKVLQCNPRLLQAHLDDDLEDQRALFGCARSLTGVWPLTQEAFHRFLNETEMDWDDLGDECFDVRRIEPIQDRWIGINSIISVPHIAGVASEFGLASSLTALAKHIRQWTGPILLEREHTGPLPRFITTVEIGSLTHEWAEAAGMRRGPRTSHNWTKYWIDLNDIDHLLPKTRAKLDILIKLVNTASSPPLY